MKKAGYCLIVLTLVFSGFIGGFLFGRTYNTGDIQLSGQVSPADPEPTEATEATPLNDNNTPGVSGGKININIASVDELTALPGIGSTLAQRIVAYRNENGPFRNVDELLEVSGIGEKKLESIRQYIITGGS